jgi:hypothetical protein
MSAYFIQFYYTYFPVDAITDTPIRIFFVTLQPKMAKHTVDGAHAKKNVSQCESVDSN